MSSPDDRVSRSWRRFLRFSVRGLIVVVLVIGAGLGLAKLHRLYLGGSLVTDAGVKELQRALPNTIIRD
jgi:hypothetical protein